MSWCPQSGRVYRVVGQEYKVNTPGVNKTWYILGSLGYPDGDGLYEIYEHQDRFCLVPLPTHSPHLNLIERLWHYMRDNITRSTFYITLENLCETLVDWLREIPFERFHSLLGLSP